jgi:hypothetical protein
MSTIDTSLYGYNYYSGLGQSSGLTTSSTATSGSNVTASTSAIRAQIEALLADVPRSEGGKLTFDDVISYRDEQREAFEARVQSDLAALGVDTDLDMTFSYDANSDVLTVDSGHPDKKLIDAYFAANEDVRADFAEVVALTKLSGSAETKLTATEMRTSLQVQSMAIWAEANASNTFSGGSLFFTEEEDTPTFFGLDLMV